MSTNKHVPGPRVNRLLGALSQAELDRLLRHMELVALGTKAKLYDFGEPIEHIFFPLSGVHSILSRVGPDEFIEVATVGSEGMIGLPVFLGAKTSQNLAFSQVPGYAARMRSDVFLDVIQGSSEIHQLLYRYTQALFNQVAQGVACNRYHATVQRLARWLLQTHDRVGTDTFSLTQEFIGQMLGVRRATANEAEQALQEAGMISYQRGMVTILDRPGLEAASCVCYFIITDDFDKLIPKYPTANKDQAYPWGIPGESLGSS